MLCNCTRMGAGQVGNNTKAGRRQKVFQCLQVVLQTPSERLHMQFPSTLQESALVMAEHDLMHEVPSHSHSESAEHCVALVILSQVLAQELR